MRGVPGSIPGGSIFFVIKQVVIYENTDWCHGLEARSLILKIPTLMGLLHRDRCLLMELYYLLVPLVM